MSDAAGDSGLNGQLADVHNELMTALVNSGLMGKIRAQLRAAAVAILDDDRTALRALGSHNVKSASDRSKIALLLVEEFLQLNSMKHSLGVFTEESNVSSLEPHERNRLLEPMQQHQLVAAAGLPGDGTPQTGSLLETLIGAFMLNPPVAEQPRSLLQRAPSPDIEIAAITAATKKDVVPAATSAGGTSTSAGSRRGSASAAADALEDSVEYSDRSANSSIDITNCLAVERLASMKPSASPDNIADTATSDDDF